MSNLFTAPGFLGTKAPFISDLSLILILVTALLFTIGWQLAVRQKHTTHHWVQITAVIVNTLVVLIVMIRSFVVNILPGIPSKLGEGSYGITTVHAIVGAVSVILGIYVLLATNNLLPKSMRFTNYKPYMRVSYSMYMLATVLGVIVYVVAFVYGK
jgi:uncharacterized membrane protein YozB (DUF420 family)